jgi:geranyl-CoA carboxylase alpha subunit
MTRTPFSKLLIANRGEIAVRIMRTARQMGYRTVAVFSDADEASPHVRVADEAVGLGGALPRESYLDIAKIIEAARRSGADAIHPGYGFLAENAAFASACDEAGLVFVGPSAAAITSMGDKAEAKRLMQAAGMPCVPGYQGDDQSDETLRVEAEKTGYPVMLKAVAGGGGRGMRIVHRAEDFSDALQSARSEAAASFGNSEMLIERAIIEPRHIEIQIVADRYGHAIHLGERDCSVQRRHQKVIEEAPSPAIGAKLREEMGAAAVKAALAIGYEGAGTFEFLLDRDGHFYFMEMNTRLQVEHPVTEAITGLDLVRMQLEIAAGLPLPIAQEDVAFSGHAIEVRLCAEDPDVGFVPRSGTMQLWEPSESIRTDHALHAGFEVSPFYDSMLAKLISHGPTRDDALRILANALDDTIALGVPTNRAFAARCLRNLVFVQGAATTAFIADNLQDLLAHPDSWTFAATAAAIILCRAHPPCFDSAPSLTYSGTIPLRISINDTPLQISLRQGSHDRFEVQIDGEPSQTIEATALAETTIVLTCNGVRSSIHWRLADGTLYVQLPDGNFEVRDLSFTSAVDETGMPADGTIRAAMTGRVVAVHAAMEEAIISGQGIVTLEAMKMEQRHVAPINGVLKSLLVKAGDQVSAGQILAEVMPLEGASL